MDKILILYGSSEGQVAKVASRIADVIYEEGIAANVIDGRALPVDFSLKTYTAVIIGASIHAGRFQPYIQEFVQHHRTTLNQIPSAFFSVSLTEQYPALASDIPVAKKIANFLHETGWRPQSTASFAGALAYSRYDFLERMLLKRIARTIQAPTDSTRDYEYTDWEAVARFAKTFITVMNDRQKESVIGS